jgi:uncharacterized protein YndB with AHSA1/START domain
MGDDLIVPPDVVYVTYIRATPEAVWDALTRHSENYFFGLPIRGDWKAGGRWALMTKDGAGVHNEGEVLECDPPRRLKLSWKVVSVEEARGLPEAYITYDIEPAGEAVKLTMTQHQPKPIPRKFYEGGLQGWPKILSGLKTYLETGAPLKLGTPT